MIETAEDPSLCHAIIELTCPLGALYPTMPTEVLLSPTLSPSRKHAGTGRTRPRTRHVSFCTQRRLLVQLTCKDCSMSHTLGGFMVPIPHRPRFVQKPPCSLACSSATITCKTRGPQGPRFVERVAGTGLCALWDQVPVHGNKQRFPYPNPIQASTHRN